MIWFNKEKSKVPSRLSVREIEEAVAYQNKLDETSDGVAKIVARVETPSQMVQLACDLCPVEVEWEWAVVERTLTHRSIQDNIIVFQGDLVVFSGPAEAFADGVVILLKAAETVRTKLRASSKGENE